MSLEHQFVHLRRGVVGEWASGCQRVLVPRIEGCLLTGGQIVPCRQTGATVPRTEARRSRGLEY